MFTRLPAFLLLFAALVPYAVGQSSSSGPLAEPVRLVDLAVPKSLEAGTIGHFRARLSEGSAQPVNYLWDLGDGTLSVGALVSYSYPTPGTYPVAVVARNATGRDTLRAQVQVVPAPVRSDSLRSATVAITDDPPREGGAPKPEEAPRRARVTVPRSALFGSGGISRERGGYTWVLGSDLWGERARDRMLVYRLQGFRADLYVDSTGRGSPAHRIVLGQFATVEEAVAARAWLPAGRTGILLLALHRPSDSSPEVP